VKRGLQTLLGLGVSGGALWLTLRGKDLGAIWRAAWEADYRYLWPYFLVLVAIHFVRTVRWGILLEPVARVPFAKLNSVSAVGLMALMILPFRLGEFARPYLVAERPRLRVSAALSSVVVERVADGVFTAALLVVTLLAVPVGSPNLRLLRGAGWLMLLAFAALLAFLAVAYRSRALAVRIAHRLLDPISPRVAARLAGMLDAFIRGLRLVPSRSKLSLFFFLTFLYWALNGWGMQLLARGFGLQLALIDAYTVLGVLVVGVMIPAAPGMVGTFQYAVLLGLSLFVPPEVLDVRGQAYAYVLWAAQLLQLTSFGLFFLFSRHIQIGRIVHAPDEVEEALEAEEREYQAQESRPPPDGWR
jgi:glycosyltransferase 2 family protein